jgi:hypothetical protein
LIVERKSWSDLADSVMGKGKQRLDCVRIRNTDNEDDDNNAEEYQCQSGTCQLCRMKRSGCSKILFIIEGARCLNRDHEDHKCTMTSRCKYCQELVDRHGSKLVQEELERRVLMKLQVEHGCIIHFTRSYNETIDSLFWMRSILSSSSRSSHSNLGNGTSEDFLTYTQFCTNARRSKWEGAPFASVGWSRGEVVVWTAVDFVGEMQRGKVRALVQTIQTPCDNNSKEHTPTASDQQNDIIVLDDDDDDDDDDVVHQTNKSPVLRNIHGKSVVYLDSDDSCNDEKKEEDYDDVIGESQESIYVLEDHGWTKNKANATIQHSPCINLDSDSEDDSEVEVIPSPPAKKRRVQGRNDEDADVVKIAGTQSSRDSATIQPKRNSKNGTSQGIPLVIVHGTYEYDKEYYDDLNKIWKACYRRHHSKDAHGNNREEAFMQQLRTIGLSQNGATPFVPREIILFWCLYIQLTGHVRLYLARMSTEMRALRSAWKLERAPIRNSVMGSSTVRATDATPARRKTPPGGERLVTSTGRRGHSTKVRRSLDFAQEALCMVCKGQIQDDEETSTPCNHTFHRTCLSTWLEASGTRNCPHCNFEGIGLPKVDRPSVVVEHGNRSQGRPPKPSSLPPPPPTPNPPPPPLIVPSKQTKNPASSTDPAIREARLRRLGVSTPAAPAPRTNAVSSGRGWICGDCRLENRAATSYCEGCRSAKLQPTLPGAPVSSVAAVNRTAAIWACTKCTLENLASDMKCGACGASSPYMISDFCEPVLSSNFSAHYNPPRLAAPGAPFDSDATVPTSSAKKITCGACRRQGHNRATATEATCTAFNDPAEVEHRLKKKEEAERKAQEKRDEATRFERITQNQAQTARSNEEQIERLLAQQRRERDELQQLTQAEVKRKQKAAALAEKRARRLAG